MTKQKKNSGSKSKSPSTAGSPSSSPKKEWSFPKSKWTCGKPLYIKKDDDRYPRYRQQLKERGFSDTETWGLDSVICQFILPRLVRFREIHGGYPMGLTEEKWISLIDEMIFAFDWSLNWEDKEEYKNLTDAQKKRNWKRYERGMQTFGKWFRHLWW